MNEYRQTFFQVVAPPTFANSSLNGTTCMVESIFRDDHPGGGTTYNVLLLDGEHAGKVWQLDPAHLQPLGDEEE